MVLYVEALLGQNVSKNISIANNQQEAVKRFPRAHNNAEIMRALNLKSLDHKPALCIALRQVVNRYVNRTATSLVTDWQPASNNTIGPIQEMTLFENTLTPLSRKHL